MPESLQSEDQTSWQAKLRSGYEPVCTPLDEVTVDRRRAGVTPRTFWAAESRKSGVAPARFGAFSTVTFTCICSLSPTFQRNCSRHRVKDLEKTNVKCVVLTLFSLFP